MAKKVAQARYFGTNNPSNNVTADGLINPNASAFRYPIVQLGVQALPGTTLQINQSGTPLVIGSTGIYELDIDGLAKITELVFSRASIEMVNSYGSSIIVDYVYEE